jgi:hypothetical protein
MLDEQIDLKVKMKSILSVDQFEKWDAMKGKQERSKNTKNAEKMGDRMDRKKTYRNKTSTY